MTKNSIISPFIKKHGQVLINKDDVKLSSTEAIKKIKKAISNKQDYSNIDIGLLKIIKKNNIEETFSYATLFTISKIDNDEEIIKYLNFRYKFQMASERKLVPSIPPYILLEPASACNLKCPMCFQIDKTFTRKPYMGIMKWDLFKRLVDEANDIGVGAITLGSRGEPSMHPKYADMLKYISQKKNIFEVKTNTNATYLNEKKIHSILESDITTIVISADHYEKKAYEILRKGANFEKIINNVKLLHSIRKKDYPNISTEIRVSGVDYYENVDKKKFRDFWIKYSDNVTLTNPIERWDTYNNKPSTNENLSPCSYLWDRMYIWFDGICNPCDADYKSYLSYGNVNNSTIEKVWNSHELKELRDVHLQGKRNSKNPCDRCGIEFN